MHSAAQPGPHHQVVTVSGAFAAAAAVLFSDPNLSVAGVYTPAGGQPVPIRLMRTVGTDQVAGSLRQFGAVAEHGSAELLVRDVPERPGEGALLEFGGRVFRLDAAASPTKNGLAWLMTLVSA